MLLTSSSPRLRERLTIQLQSQTADASGQISSSWADVATVWAAMTPTNATQATIAGRDEAARLYDAIIRYRTDVTTNCRVLWDPDKTGTSRQFDVGGIVNSDRQRHYLTLKLSEKNA